VGSTDVRAETTPRTVLMSAEQGASHPAPHSTLGASSPESLTSAAHIKLTIVNPDSVLLTVDEVAVMLRTSRKAVYSMTERGQLRQSFGSVVVCSFAERPCYTGWAKSPRHRWKGKRR
jgi:helix-turn-helix protein